MEKKVTSKELYNSIISFVEHSLSAVLKPTEGGAKSLELEQVRANAKQILTQYKQKTEMEVKELERLSEWDVFTVVFYGETNAGKSTLIETLRILLGEGEKHKTRQQFHELTKNIDFEQLAKSDERIRLLPLELDERKKAAESFQHALRVNVKREQDTLAKQACDLEQKKQNRSLFQKIMDMFRKMEEEAVLEDARVSFAALQASHIKLGQARSAAIAVFERKVAEELRGFAEAKKAIEALEPLQDGEIIGTGRSDFTRHVTAYPFQIGEERFQLLDVPGIEGDEKIVQAQIDESVKKAHVVFYVTRKATPPGSGSEGQEGTIDKIKRQLGDQAEVWAIYNKAASNARALAGNTLLNDGEQESLKAMEASLLAQLGAGVFQGVKTVSCLPAFYASAPCLLPTNTHHRSKNKFLEAMPADELLRRSGMTEFIKFLTNEICVNYKPKIKHANLKKIRTCLEQGIAYVQELRKTFDTLAKNLSRQYQSSFIQIDELLEATTRRLQSECKDALSTKKADSRTSIYNFIETDCSNDDFKSKLKSTIDALKKSVGVDLEMRFEGVFNTFKADVQEIVKKNKRNVDEIMEYSMPQNMFKSEFSFRLDFEMDNGINVLGIVSSLGGAAALIFTAFLTSNPVGWTVASVLGAIGLVLSFYTAIRGWLSSDFKMEQQRESADENLKNVFDKLEEVLVNNLSKAGEKLGEALAETKVQLKMPFEQSQTTIETLSEIALRMTDFKKRIV
ncbi:hypothetical protein AwPolaro_00550 [Polaromonas sp.]|nr:hypothetical protein AwPolaro_00550 [Polaromonas sp.]